MWTMVLKDGSRHAVTGDIRFRVRKGIKFLDGTLDVTPPVFKAFEESEVMFVAPQGSEYWAMITSIDHRGATLEGLARIS